MTIRQQGGIFGRNPTFNNVTVDGTLTVDQVVEKTGAAGITLDGVTLKDGNVVLADGKGIDFSATAGTGTSELFDDYEEGTWTPASATNCTVNSVLSAFYTKVGRMVHCYCYVNITTTGLNFTIAGLPYVCTNGFGPASLYYLTGGGIASIYGSQQNYVNNGSSDLKLGLGATVTGALVMLTASYYN